MPEHLTSIDDLISLRDTQQKQGTLRAAAATDREIGIRLAEDGFYERGLGFLQAARRLFGDDSYDGAVCDHSIGIVLAELARYEESAAALDHARTVYGSLHRFLAVADCDEHLGQSLLVLDHPLDAIARFESARRIHVEMNTLERITACDEGIQDAKAALHPAQPNRGRPRRAHIAQRVAAA